METVLNLLLVRFALIACGLVALALVVFAGALALKRRGRLGDVRRHAAPAARAAVRYLDERRAARGSAPSALLGATLRAAARSLDDRSRR